MIFTWTHLDTWTLIINIVIIRYIGYKKHRKTFVFYNASQKVAEIRDCPSSHEPLGHRPSFNLDISDKNNIYVFIFYFFDKCMYA